MRPLTRFSADVKAELLALVARTQARTGWTRRRLLHRLGLTKARDRDWVTRAKTDALADRAPIAANRDGILIEERAAVFQYALEHPKDGSRRLTWPMSDASIAYLSESSVDRILQASDRLSRWKRSTAVGTPPAKPTRPHERWHTDLRYLRVADPWYFLVTVLDADSRSVVHWELLTTMTAADVGLVMQQALEQTGATPQVVTDTGSPFTAAAFTDLVRRFAFEHMRIRTYHPESNGPIERFHRTTREAIGDETLRNVSQARAMIARWIAQYNEERLHAGLGYLTPADYYRGNPAARRAVRQPKLETARQARQLRNTERLRRAA